MGGFKTLTVTMRKDLSVGDKKIRIREINGHEMFSLTDMAKNYGKGSHDNVLFRWFKNRDTLDFLEAYEERFNPDNKLSEVKLRDEFGENGDGRTLTDYVKITETPFIKVSRGRFGGTWATFDIASAFMMWVNKRFMVWFIYDYRRMKEEEDQKKIGYEKWKTQKKVDNLIEVLRFEQDELNLLEKQHKKLKK